VRERESIYTLNSLPSLALMRWEAVYGWATLQTCVFVCVSVCYLSRLVARLQPCVEAAISNSMYCTIGKWTREKWSENHLQNSVLKQGNFWGESAHRSLRRNLSESILNIKKPTHLDDMHLKPPNRGRGLTDMIRLTQFAFYATFKSTLQQY